MKFLKALFLVVLLAAAAAGYVLYVPFGPGSETFVDIPSGSGTEAMASDLERAGIIRSRYAFYLLRTLRGGRLKAGEYRFDHPLAMTAVYDRIARGDVYTRVLKIPEGYNIFDIAAAVEAAGLGSRDAFLAAEHRHTSLIATLSPSAPSLEGFLFPDTYRFSRHATPEQILTTMVKRFRQQTAALNLSGDIAATVNMASLIEKEVHQDSERPLVAGVFVNRLARGMPLQTDPAVVYAALLDGRYRGTIFASDLQSASPYNTYRHAGLPPGPICNPGLAALRAALAPARTDFLYFVSDAAGHTRFSATLAEHAQQVQAFRDSSRNPSGAASSPASPPAP